MRKKFSGLILIFVVLIGLTGCKNKDNVNVEKLTVINNEIIDYFNQNPESEVYDNFCFNYIDEKSLTVIVGLIDNSEQQQDNFKEKVVDSKLIKFIQGSKNINLPAKNNG